METGQSLMGQSGGSMPPPIQAEPQGLGSSGILYSTVHDVRLTRYPSVPLSALSSLRRWNQPLDCRVLVLEGCAHRLLDESVQHTCSARDIAQQLAQLLYHHRLVRLRLPTRMRVRIDPKGELWSCGVRPRLRRVAMGTLRVERGMRSPASTLTLSPGSTTPTLPTAAGSGVRPRWCAL